MASSHCSHRCSGFLPTLSGSDTQARSGSRKQYVPACTLRARSDFCLLKTRRQQQRCQPTGCVNTPCLVSGFYGQQPRNLSSATALTGRSLGSMRVAASGGRVMAQWLENNAEVQADVPLEECWEHWLDREKIPQWMPWISSVKVLEDKPDLSRWTLKYGAFDQDFTFSWLARNLQPIYHQKIHWRAVDGLANRGAVRFFKNRDGSCQIKMTISYEVPSVLAPLAQSVTPIVEGIIQRDLERFVDYARKNRVKVPATK